MLKTMINRLKNAIGQAITIAISRTQSLYKGNKGSEIKTEKKKLVELWGGENIQEITFNITNAENLFFRSHCSTT